MHALHALVLSRKVLYLVSSVSFRQYHWSLWSCSA
jgi:hypothetical protein